LAGAHFFSSGEQTAACFVHPVLSRADVRETDALVAARSNRTPR
jgi:hypothetical protein